MECVNCGHENLEKALICYWCGLDPDTGEPPYRTMKMPDVDQEIQVVTPDVTLPPEIPMPPPIQVPSVTVGLENLATTDLAMPEVPTIEIAPPPAIPDPEGFIAVKRRRVRHRPVVRRAPPPPQKTEPILPARRRLMVFVVGLGLLLLLGSALVAAVGAASLGTVFCLTGLFGLAFAVWAGLLLARAGRRVASATDAAYQRIQVLGRTLREVAPGTVKELPVNLPAQLKVLDLPLAYSELRYLAHEGQPSQELAVDLLTGAIASLVGRDDAVLARRTFPVKVRGVLASSEDRQVSQPVIMRRRAYAGPGELEEQLARALRTDRPMTIPELMEQLLGSEGQAGRLIAWVDHALADSPPDLEKVDSPDAALAQMEKYREAIKKANPELYQALEAEIRRGLGAATQRSVASSLLDLARYAQKNTRR